MVASSFVENPYDKPEVNHKDGVKDNDYYKNLEWTTRSENHQHACDNGLMDRLYKSISYSNRGEGNCNSKLDKKEVSEIKQLLRSSDLKQYEIADIFGVHKSIISKINTGEIWSHIE